MLRWPAANALVLSVILFLGGLLDSVERALVDTRAQMTMHTVDSELTLVEIDSRSLDKLNTPPWPRSYHAMLLQELRSAGARRVFLDVDLNGPSTPAEDRQFIRALASFQRERILLPVSQQFLTATTPQEQVLLRQPAPAFTEHASLASIILRPERDGLIRRIPLGSEGELQEALPASVLLNEVKAAPTDELHIDYAISPASFPRLSYSDVLAGNFPRELIENRLVVVGTTALQISDGIAVPLHRSLPGPVLQALAYQSLHEGPLTPTPTSVTLMLMALLALAVRRPLSRLGWRAALAVNGTVGAALFLISIPLYSEFRLILDTTPLLAVLVVSYSLAVLSQLDQQSIRLMVQRRASQRTDALMTNIVHNSIDGIVTVDAQGFIRNINPAALSMFGLRSDHALGMQFSTLINDEQCITKTHKGRNPAIIKACIRETTARHASGRTFPIDIAISRLSFKGEELYTAFVRDISQRKTQQAALKHQATHDTLTGLGNRALLHDRLEHLISESDAAYRSAAVMMLDLDRFKEINDTLGHHVGDIVLKEVAERLAAAVGPENAVARFGGDEFAILVPECSHREMLLEVVNNVLDAVQKPVDANGVRLTVGGSIGIARYPDDGRTPATLLQCADVAMYLAKRAQSGFAMYDPALDKNSMQRLTLTTDLRTAIESDQLTLFYQPQVDLRTSDVVCMEALLRWQHPSFGVVDPVDVMDIAESTDLIKPLTIWTLNTALKEVATLHEHGRSIRVAVNLSARLLHDPALPEILRNCINASGAQPDWLMLEITESAIISDAEHALFIVEQIAAMGINLAIDDFGTGYSSLAYLKHLPAYELKIDKSFVIDMHANDSDTTIVRSTIELAHNLSMRVVAEGVETEQAWRTLQRLGCDVAQGYWIARPMSAADFDKWIEHWLDSEQQAYA
ncbi:EAL domain-containing protein [Thiogranum longum]